MREAGIQVDIRIGEYHDAHPNTYRWTLSNSEESHHMIALSTGGGMVEIVEIDRVPLSIQGDYLRPSSASMPVDMALHETLKPMSWRKISCCTHGKNKTPDRIRSRKPLSESVRTLARRWNGSGVDTSPGAACCAHLSRRDLQVPFTNHAPMLDWNVTATSNLAGLAIDYESGRGASRRPEVLTADGAIVRVLRAGSIAPGCLRNSLADRILGVQSAGSSRYGSGALLTPAISTS